MKNSSKKNTVASASSASSAVSINDFPALPCMFDRLRRLNHGIDILRAKATLIELAIEMAPVNLQTLADDLKINAYIANQKQFGIEINRVQAMQMLQIVRADKPVTLTGTRIPVKVDSTRSNETLELKANDIEILRLYKQYGFMTHADFVKRIQLDGVKVTRAVLSRYSNIAKQIAFLQGKQGNNGYLKDIQIIGCTPLEMLSQLSVHEKYDVDQSTFALTKRAVRIYAALI